MSVKTKARETMKREGLRALPARTTLFLLRRVAWRTDAWSKHLDFQTQAKTLVRDCRELLAKNEIFRDCHKGRRSFVIGNGPSLSEQDLSPLKDELTFVANNFYRHPILEEWSPSYYFLTDHMYFDGSEMARGWLQEIRERVGSDTRFFVPHYAREALAAGDLLPPERTFYVAALGGLEDEWTEKPDLTSVTPGMQTVVQLAIMAAMFMGCSPIYLLGMDHDWLKHPGEHTTFYAKPVGQLEDDAQKWSYRSLMEAVLVMWRVYEMHQRIAERAGLKIINASKGGFLDVFERADYEEVMNERD